MLNILKSIFVSSLLFLVCTSSNLFASPIEITSGTISPRGSLFGQHDQTTFIISLLEFRFSGDQFFASGGNGGQPPLGKINTCGNNCVEGDVISPDGQISTGTIKRTGNGSGTFIYNGDTYRVLQASFSFTGPESSLPNFIDISASGFDLSKHQIPFNMTGTLLLNSLSADIPDFTVTLTGSGIANFTYVSGEGAPNITSPGKAFLGKIEYIFGATPEPVPEPATIFLLGMGLVGIGGYASRKRKNQNR